jgi:uncharacterized protein
VGLLTTYRRNGEPVATPVSIAVRAGNVYFVTSATSGKARRLALRPDVTVAPATLRGTATGPARPGRARLLSKAGRRLLQPGGALFWSYLLYRIRGRRMQVYEVRLVPPGEFPSQVPAPIASTARVYRAVQLTARTSALLFAAAQAAAALGPRAERASRPLYVAFMAAHAVHFSVVARYAVVNDGRDLFPGGRSLDDVGGWPTVAGIYTFFAGLAVTGWATGRPRAVSRRAMRIIGQAATWLMAGMFVEVYLRQLPRSRWYAVPATAVAGAVTAKVVGQRLRRKRRPSSVGR